MSWLTNYVKKPLQSVLNTRETPDNLWHKCSNCGQMIFQKDYEAAHYVCGHCDHHGRMPAKARLELLFDRGMYDSITMPDVLADPLKFRDTKRYADRLRGARSATGDQDAILAGEGKIGGQSAVIAVQNFFFMGGSMGMAVGEGIITAIRRAITLHVPFIMVTASGGARMQEGILSLMQMPRTTAVLQELREAGLPYVVLLADPTSGGVSASYAMLGDIHVAEPGAMIAFSGPRVIEQTIGEKLPEGFQRAEYLRDHGMVDKVIHRRDMPRDIGTMLGLLMGGRYRRRTVAAE